MTMIERLARAAEAAMDDRDFHEPSHEDFVLAVRAVLTELLTPDEGMLVAGWENTPCEWYSELDEEALRPVFTAMILSARDR